MAHSIDAEVNKAILVRCDAPPKGWVLLNSNRASKGNMGTAARGDVLRREQGQWF